MKANLFDLRAYAHHWHQIADAATLVHKAMTADELTTDLVQSAIGTAHCARSVACHFDELVARIESEGRNEP